ncbi:MAG: HAMP domain-containing histidine kinase [Vicinamibacteria bacterium]|nr:HAMP domain-containing histidine kinase [Vicinamibacteria bacterium]
MPPTPDARDKERDDEVSRLLIMIVHQARNPLFTISAMIDLLEEDLGDQKDAPEFLATARGELQRVNGLLSDLAEYADPAVKNRAYTTLAEIASRAVDDERPHARDADVRIEYGLEEKCSTRILAHAVSLCHAIRRLIAHAVSRSPRGGGVRVTVGNGGVECWIEDRGESPGPEILERLCEPFFVRPPGQSGLALAIARRVVELHGGRLSARPSMRGGLLVALSLPPVMDGAVEER